MRGKLLFVKSVLISKSSGITKLEAFFPGKNVFVDDNWRLIEERAPIYRTPKFSCLVFETHVPNMVDEMIFTALGPGGQLRSCKLNLEVDAIFGILNYLGGKGSSLLEISKNRKETNLVVAYKDSNFVYYVKHELGPEKRSKIHLLSQQVDTWHQDDLPISLLAVPVIISIS